MLEQFLEKYPHVKHVELVLIDPNGVARGKWAPVSTLKKAFGEGVNFPLSLHGLDVWGNEVEETGLHISSGDLDGFCVAVPHTLVPLTSASGSNLNPEEAREAQVILKTLTPQHEPFWGCSRTVLENVVSRLAHQDLTAVCAFELEFHLVQPNDGGAEAFRPAEHGEAPDAQLMYDLDALAEKAPVIADIRKGAEWADLPIDTIVKEAGPGQYEINLNHRSDALRAADDVVLLKRIVREAARRHGMIATFMAKPFMEQPGNGMHVHTSLLDGEGANVFSESDGDNRLRHAVAGCLASLQEMALVFINTKNGFRRMAAGSYAPTRVNWGSNNRSVAVRLPAAPDAAKRLEHRVSGADANPYLVLATILQGMFDGLSKAEMPQAELTGNAYDAETPNRGDSLPADMTQALELFTTSQFAKTVMGSDMCAAFSAIKQAEIDRFAADMSSFERRTYI